MKTQYLVARKSGRKKFYHFRSFIPKDLILKFNGRKEFQISLKNVTNEKKLMISIYLKTLTEQMFHEIRNGENITIDEIKDYLKSEVRKYKWFFKTENIFVIDQSQEKKEEVLRWWLVEVSFGFL